MRYPKAMRAVVTAALCVTVGAAAGIAGSAAAPAKHKKASTKSATKAQKGPRGGPHGMSVHEEAVVLNKAGTAFITVTEDNGTVASLSGDQLSIKEAVGSVTYKTATVTIPAGATVYRNFKKAALSDLKSGDRVHVSQSSDGTMVFADDGTVKPPHRGRGPGGPHPDGPGHGPPPGP